MIALLRAWFQRYFSDPQVISLILLIVSGTAVVLFTGRLLAPLIAALVVAFVLEGGVLALVRLGMPRSPAVWGVFLLFMTLVALILGGLVPLLSRQVAEFLRELPHMIAQGQEALQTLPQRYPHFISDIQIKAIMGELQHALGGIGQQVLSLSLASVIGLITLSIYLILVPLLVFFMLKDKALLLSWAQGLLPRQQALASEVWHEVNLKIVGYVRGKLVEITVVWLSTYIAFALLNLHYALLLAVLVGLSVIIPYVGAAVVTLPVIFVAYAQWGLSGDFFSAVGAYAVIQFIDGNLLVPLLFSEMVNLHPVAIIAAVLLFGGLWGVWGVFFAIPLATLVQAVLHAWVGAVRRADGELPPA
ncbi:AI-2E family transporter [Acidihalobacter yilgarnensis]|uniref:AI-2E family transporter n=1 Tax=Acidihalobacter yilgarnensis TaxID=2819280 RepID=A0A1D8IQ53_9GAMM|nr:AI-2E family transporter [Acidihalobacter yilgarnensis]AOU98589.1 AI-2E family transporter [Acidihalobacter yilgarnensis]